MRPRSAFGGRDWPSPCDNRASRSLDSALSLPRESEVNRALADMFRRCEIEFEGLYSAQRTLVMIVLS